MIETSKQPPKIKAAYNINMEGIKKGTKPENKPLYTHQDWQKVTDY